MIAHVCAILLPPHVRDSAYPSCVCALHLGRRQGQRDPIQDALQQQLVCPHASIPRVSLSKRTPDLSIGNCFSALDRPGHPMRQLRDIASAFLAVLELRTHSDARATACHTDEMG
jgi:hypothetical protein